MSYIWTADKHANMKAIFAAMNTTWAVVEITPEKKIRPVRDLNPWPLRYPCTAQPSFQFERSSRVSQFNHNVIIFFFAVFQLSYTSPYMSVLKVFDMMAGGVEFNHYFVENLELRMPDLARFICFTFILVMSISLMNLLVSNNWPLASTFLIMV